MKGLIKNNFYAAADSAKWLAVLFLIFGAAVVVVGLQAPLMIYSLLCMVGFSANAIASLRRESASKWSRYKLTLPVRRADIIRSQFISQLLWILVGALLVGICVGLSVLFHGYQFDKSSDVLLLFTMGISVSLFMGALFYPLFYLGGEERNEAILGISLVGSIGIFMGLTWLIDLAFGFAMDLKLWQILLSAGLLLTAAALSFALSYLIAVGIFKRKEQYA